MNYIKLNRNVVKVSGGDAYKFLQGLVSNDMGKISADSAIFCYLLTPQGKYIYDMFISKFEDGFAIDISANYVEAFLKKAKLYKLRSNVNIENTNYQVIAIIGGKPALQNLYSDPRNENMGYRAIVKSEDKLEMNKAGYDEYTKLRIENMVMEGELDLEAERSFPLQYRMKENNAVCFKKGCYVGQEVTARTHHRGVIRKTVYKITADKDLDNLENKIITTGTIEAGRLLSTYKNTALAMLDIELVEKKSEFSIGDIALKVSSSN